MAQTSAGAGPIPPAKKDDSEDVAWALSTAEAMYARGDQGDALKWLRRAAESASEAQADDRALELAKAAADLASTLGPSTSAPPPPPPPPPPGLPGSPPSHQPPPPQPSYPAPAPTPARAAPPPSNPAPVQARPAASAPPSPPARPPAPPGKPPGPPPKPPTRAVSPFAPAAVRSPEARRAARRSRPEISFAGAGDEVTRSVVTGDATPAPPESRPGPPESKRARRASRPAAEEVTPSVQAIIPPPSEPTPFPERQTRPVDIGPSAATDEMDAWPTQSLLGDDLADPPDEKTRIGVPAYEASARLASEAAEASPGRLAPAPQATHDPGLRPSQAVRVVVWRAADGVHVAPQGTRVAAISVDAVLVALDPSADLAAWLTGK